MTSPTFTHKLTYTEQEALSPDDRVAYWDWLFDYNDPITHRWATKEYAPRRGLDQESAKKNEEDY